MQCFCVGIKLICQIVQKLLHSFLNITGKISLSLVKESASLIKHLLKNATSKLLQITNK